jgi:CPA2 family monovalent cation:H+ antiporter-2
LALVAGEKGQLKYLAEAGALLLLFAIGIEFSLGELLRMSRFFFLGGSVQMLLVAGPVVGVCLLLGVTWNRAVLIGPAVAFSSTVLVFRALEEWGQAASPHGRRAVGILLFQDAALVPLLLLVPLLTGQGPAPDARTFLALALRATAFLTLVVSGREVIRWSIVPLLAGLRSTELVVLFALTVLAAACLGAYAIGLTPALGAFAAGLALSDNRLTAQINALILPYRETFAAVFFVSLGTLMRFDVLDGLAVAALAFGLLAAVFLLKTAAAAVALRLVGLPWRASLGMGLGLAQLGEFSFVLLSQGLRQGVLDADLYNRMLFAALGTLIVTPLLLRVGLAQCGDLPGTEPERSREPEISIGPGRTAMVIGLGPIGRQVASRLELSGIDAVLVDLNPVNLHSFAQQGFHTISGDAADPDVLRRAGVERCRLAVVTVPDDRVSVQTVRALRQLNRRCKIRVRCRYQFNAAKVRRAGADAVVSDEAEASEALLRIVQQIE